MWVRVFTLLVWGLLGGGCNGISNMVCIWYCWLCARLNHAKHGSGNPRGKPILRSCLYMFIAFLMASTVVSFRNSIDRSTAILLGQFLFTAATSHFSAMASVPDLIYHSEILCISLKSLSTSFSDTGLRSYSSCINICCRSSAMGT